MQTKHGGLQLPPYSPADETTKVKAPETANIIPLDFVPFCCRQEEQGKHVLSNRDLEKLLARQLKLSRKTLEELKKACEEGKDVFRQEFSKTGMST